MIISRTIHDLGAQIIKKDLNVGGTPTGDVTVDYFDTHHPGHCISISSNGESCLFDRQRIDQLLDNYQDSLMIHRSFDVLQGICGILEEQIFSLLMDNTLKRNILLISISIQDNIG